ncbi:MBL fold metallo-hydrolase [Candidatus Sumerlaeota bacterium]|nr:MBL fold metallo-hydrolase [Candidatus Sumerlaeota bacterium]
MASINGDIPIQGLAIKMRYRQLFIALVVLLLARGVQALAPQPNSVFVRIADIGAGLCCVIQINDGDETHYLIYDAGPPDNGGAPSFKAIKDIIPVGSTVDLMVLSHSDADHIAAVNEICDAYKVRRVLRTGDQRTSKTWQTAMAAIAKEVETDGCVDLNLATTEFPFGATYQFGDAYATFVYGRSAPKSTWVPDLSSGEKNNCISIVMRLSYDGQSILFTGDTVGRHILSPEKFSAFSEADMVRNSEIIPIKSDVIIAPHHGADNCSSADFIRAVRPRYVVFSCGSHFHHPRNATVQRYRKFAGVRSSRFFRTDRGDDEGKDKPGEEDWTGGNGKYTNDVEGRDAVDILIEKKEGRKKGKLTVAYQNP